VITRAPHVLGYSPSNIARFLIFLLHEIGVEQLRVARLLTQSPQLLGLSVENNIRPKVRFLVEEVGMSEQALGQVIGSFPNILGYSVQENMRPKLQYVSKYILKVPMSKLGRPLAKCPQLLGYSLEKRIKPRYLLLAKRGLKLGLSRMLAPTDLEFRRILRIHDAQLEEERRATHAAAAAIRAYSPWEEEGDEDDEGPALVRFLQLTGATDLMASKVIGVAKSSKTNSVLQGSHVHTPPLAVAAVVAGAAPKFPVSMQVCPQHEVRLMDEWVAVVSAATTRGVHAAAATRSVKANVLETTREDGPDAPVYYWH